MTYLPGGHVAVSTAREVGAAQGNTIKTFINEGVFETFGHRFQNSDWSQIQKLLRTAASPTWSKYLPEGILTFRIGAITVDLLKKVSRA